MVVAGELEQPRVKPDRGALAFEHRTLEIVVDQGAAAAADRVERLDMAAQKTLQGLIEREDRPHGPRVQQHHHETRQRAGAVADLHGAEAAPINLRFVPDKRGEASIQRGRHLWPEPADESAHLRGRAGIPAHPQHLVEPRGAEAWVLGERVAHEGQIRIELGAATGATADHARLGDRGAHRLMMDAEIGGDRADLPMLAIVESADFGVLLGSDHRVLFSERLALAIAPG